MASKSDPDTRFSDSDDDVGEGGIVNEETCGITRDAFFMLAAVNASLRSRFVAGDSLPSVGCAIRTSGSTGRRQIISVGWNEFPHAMEDLQYDHDHVKKKTTFDSMHSLHAEVNAILLGDRDLLRGAVLYSTLFPCDACARVIIQAGVVEVVYLVFSETYASSVRLFDEASVAYGPLDPKSLEMVERNIGDLGNKVLSHLREKALKSHNDALMALETKDKRKDKQATKQDDDPVRVGLLNRLQFPPKNTRKRKSPKKTTSSLTK